MLMHTIHRREVESNDQIYKLITENERQNLCIRKGTLLVEEIEKMREHALVSHEMLSKLSFPKKFQHVPKYACGHHERLNGDKKMEIDELFKMFTFLKRRRFLMNGKELL